MHVHSTLHVGFDDKLEKNNKEITKQQQKNKNSNNKSIKPKQKDKLTVKYNRKRWLATGESQEKKVIPSYKVSLT